MIPISRRVVALWKRGRSLSNLVVEIVPTQTTTAIYVKIVLIILDIIQLKKVTAKLTSAIRCLLALVALLFEWCICENICFMAEMIHILFTNCCFCITFPTPTLDFLYLEFLATMIVVITGICFVFTSLDNNVDYGLNPRCDFGYRWILD